MTTAVTYGYGGVFLGATRVAIVRSSAGRNQTEVGFRTLYRAAFFGAGNHSIRTSRHFWVFCPKRHCIKS